MSHLNRPQSPEDVLERLIEAVEVNAAVAKGDGPRAIFSAWPDYRRQIARRKRIYPPRQISRAEEALTWFSLIDDTDARRALQFEVMCKAGGGKFSKICDKYGWKRTTVTSRNKVVLCELAKRLGTNQD